MNWAALALVAVLLACGGQQAQAQATWDQSSLFQTNGMVGMHCRTGNCGGEQNVWAPRVICSSNTQIVKKVKIIWDSWGSMNWVRNICLTCCNIEADQLGQYACDSNCDSDASGNGWLGFCHGHDSDKTPVQSELQPHGFSKIEAETTKVHYDGDNGNQVQDSGTRLNGIVLKVSFTQSLQHASTVTAGDRYAYATDFRPSYPTYQTNYKLQALECPGSAADGLWYIVGMQASTARCNNLYDSNGGMHGLQIICARITCPCPEGHREKNQCNGKGLSISDATQRCEECGRGTYSAKGTKTVYSQTKPWYWFAMSWQYNLNTLVGIYWINKGRALLQTQTTARTAVAAQFHHGSIALWSSPTPTSLACPLSLPL